MEELLSIVYTYEIQILYTIIAVILILQIAALLKIRKQKKITELQIKTLQGKVDDFAKEQDALKKRLDGVQEEPEQKREQLSTEKESPDKLIDAVLSEIFS